MLKIIFEVLSFTDPMKKHDASIKFVDKKILFKGHQKQIKAAKKLWKKEITI